MCRGSRSDLKNKLHRRFQADLKREKQAGPAAGGKSRDIDGPGKAIAERPRLEVAIKELSQIAGQKAVICKAKKRCRTSSSAKYGRSAPR